MPLFDESFPSLLSRPLYSENDNMYSKGRLAANDLGYNQPTVVRYCCEVVEIIYRYDIISYG